MCTTPSGQPGREDHAVAVCGCRRASSHAGQAHQRDNQRRDGRVGTAPPLGGGVARRDFPRTLRLPGLASRPPCSARRYKHWQGENPFDATTGNPDEHIIIFSGRRLSSRHSARGEPRRLSQSRPGRQDVNSEIEADPRSRQQASGSQCAGGRSLRGYPRSESWLEAANATRRGLSPDGLFGTKQARTHHGHWRKRDRGCNTGSNPVEPRPI